MKMLFILLIFLNTIITKTYAVGADTESALKFFNEKEYAKAANLYYDILAESKLQKNTNSETKYNLAMSLYNLGLYRASAEFFTELAQEKSEIKQKSLEKVLDISAKIGDSKLLNQAIRKMQATELQNTSKEIFYLKLAAANLSAENYDAAIKNFNLSIEENSKSFEAYNLLALSLLKTGQNDKAIATYNLLLDIVKNSENNSELEQYVKLNLARAYYQAGKYVEAISMYKQIQKNSPAYRESILEVVWANLYLNKLSDAISELQSLHTPFYENFYDPESLFLRAILLNSQCRLDDSSLAIQAFIQNYGKSITVVKSWLSVNSSSIAVFDEINFAFDYLKLQKDKKLQSDLIVQQYPGRLPFKVTRSVIENGSFKESYNLHQNIFDEYKKVNQALGVSDSKLSQRINKMYLDEISKNTEEVKNKFIKTLNAINEEAVYFNNQLALVNYEIIDTKKKQIRAKLQVKKNDSSESAISKSSIKSRSDYENEGLRYWPYEEEHWQDEVGKYKYSGDNICEK